MVGGRRAIALVLGLAGAVGLGLGLAYPALAVVAWLGGVALVAALAAALLAPRAEMESFATAPVAPAHVDFAPYVGPPAAEAGGRPVDAVVLEAAQEPEPSPSTDEPEIQQGDEGFSAPTGVEPSDALEAFVSAASPVGELVSAHMWLLDPATRTMRLIVAFGDMRPNAEPVPIDSSVIGEAAEEGHAVLRAEQRRVQGGAESTVWRYAVPLKAGDASGCAALDFLADKPTGAALNRAAALTRGSLAAALALHVSRTETAAAGALMTAAREILRLVDPQRVVEVALKHAVRLSGAETGSIMLLDPDGQEMRIRTAIGLPDRVVAQTRVSEGEGIAGWVLATGRSMVVEDLEDKGPRSRRHGVRSAMAVPIADEDGVLGVLNVGSRVFHARFSASHLETLESLGQVVGLALRNAAAHESSRELYLETVRALALALETKDPYSRGTTDRVHDLAEALGEAMGLTPPERQALRVASLLHDIGMNAAGDLSGAGKRPLSTVEWAMLKMHPVIAADVLEQASALKAAVPIVYHHHEHYDGGGYVSGLSGEQIPIGARVLSVVDAYVAMTSVRSYRPAKTHEDALAELEDKAGSQFDPEVVRALVELLGTSERTARER